MLKRILIAALWLPLIALGQTYPSPTYQNLTVLGTFTATGKVGLPSLAAQAANTVVGNASGSSASPTAITVTGCNGAAQALQWTNSVGFGCNSSVATSGANLNITSLGGLTTPLSVAQGGTGDNTLAQYNILAGNGTGGIAAIGPSTAGFVLTSNGASAFPSFQNAVAGRLIGIQIFTSSGTYTPTPGTNSVIVQVVGGGGGGAGVAAGGSGTGNFGGGGASGSYAAAKVTSAFSGATVTIGAAGSGGASGGNNSGASGGTTSFGSIVSCPGGGGGNSTGATATAVIASGGTSTTTCTISGATAIANMSGRSGGLGLSGNNVLSGGAGGNSELGSGGSAMYVGGSASGAGNPGTGYGGGGGGAASGGSSGVAAAGGAASIGAVIVYEYN
jgi:hypothetical protein